MLSKYQQLNKSRHTQLTIFKRNLDDVTREISQSTPYVSFLKQYGIYCTQEAGKLLFLQTNKSTDKPPHSRVD